MMNIWIGTGDIPAGDSLCRYGRFVSGGGTSVGGSPALHEIRDADEFARRGTASSWYLGTAAMRDGALLAFLAETGRPVLVSVNDAEAEDLAQLRSKIPTSSLILALDATAIDEVAAIEGLVRLSRRLEGFALRGGSRTLGLMALALGASHLVIPDGSQVDVGAFRRIADARRVSAAARDDFAHPVETERCLTVRRPLEAGAVIAADDLDVAATEFRGLGPAMSAHVVGMRLRYPVLPGEALHFGHFHDRHAAGS